MPYLFKTNFKQILSPLCLWHFCSECWNSLAECSRRHLKYLSKVHPTVWLYKDSESALSLCMHCPTSKHMSPCALRDYPRLQLAYGHRFSVSEERTKQHDWKLGKKRKGRGKDLGGLSTGQAVWSRGDFTSFGKQRDTYGRDCAPGDSTGEQLLCTVSQIRDNSASKGWMWARCTKWLQRYLRYRDGNLSPGLKCRWGSAERAATQISWSWEKPTLKGNETKLKEIGWDSIKPEKCTMERV